ncbi:two component transcriptional regulator, LuxR family [Gloeothece citriformis PCC 7424]|uniref:Two component transcriptional regulator, LuxR family n=1 Tax=Gloeothece citriformis (strain PCC 7424) TaxID=65393 RepID=B7K8A2_GLOC7|nr:response regulator transcription factor [Gloeothece citriformis]ACK69862.1 two component transcriptional regulator, LuxR family [Gloeothece citriformis PCC 7424]
MNKISVVLVEDHDLSRVGLCAALQQNQEIGVIGEAANGQEALRVIRATQPDVAVVDIGLPDIDGIEVTQTLKHLATQGEELRSKILILTMHKTEDSVMAAFAAGADSYALKDISLDNLVQAIKATHEGNAWIDPAIARIVLKQAKNDALATSIAPKVPETVPPQNSHQTRVIESVDPEYQQLLESDPLTDRELDVLELIVAGCNNAQIAEKLYITVGTVKTHVRNILNKLCVNDRTQAAVRALRSGLVG